MSFNVGDRIRRVEYGAEDDEVLNVVFVGDNFTHVINPRGHREAIHNSSIGEYALHREAPVPEAVPRKKLGRVLEL